MALTNYQRGANKERRIVNAYREKGWIALRSAGSHSPIDVVCINPATKEIKLIQSKLGELGKSEKRDLEIEMLSLSGMYFVQGELWN
jgi:Holliday junction resolvase